MKSRAVCGLNPTKRPSVASRRPSVPRRAALVKNAALAKSGRRKKDVFRERASVPMRAVLPKKRASVASGAVLPKKMDVQSVGFQLYGKWTAGRMIDGPDSFITVVEQLRRRRGFQLLPRRERTRRLGQNSADDDAWPLARHSSPLRGEVGTGPARREGVSGPGVSNDIYHITPAVDLATVRTIDDRQRNFFEASCRTRGHRGSDGESASASCAASGAPESLKTVGNFSEATVLQRPQPHPQDRSALDCVLICQTSMRTAQSFCTPSGCSVSPSCTEDHESAVYDMW